MGSSHSTSSARDLLGNLVALTSIAVLTHIQCINTHGGRYGNSSSDLRAPLGLDDREGDNRSLGAQERECREWAEREGLDSHFRTPGSAVIGS